MELLVCESSEAVTDCHAVALLTRFLLPKLVELFGFKKPEAVNQTPEDEVDDKVSVV